MKLTEAKLKQMILETMQRSRNYEKLKTLMVTKEGLLQAESLYEMVRGTFDEEEQMHMDILFAPLELAREREELREKYLETYDAFTAASSEDQEEAFTQMDLAEKAVKDKNEEWSSSFRKLKSHLKQYSSELPYELHGIIVDASLDIMTRVHKYVGVRR